MKALRWFAVIPAALAAYLLAKLVAMISVYPFLPELVSYLNSHRGFGTYVLLGPLFTIYREVLGTTAAMIVSHRVAPSSKRIGLALTTGFWLLVNLIGFVTTHSVPVATSIAVRMWVESGAQAVAIVLVLIHSWKLDPSAK